MSLSKEQFVTRWKDLGENQEPHMIDTAWRRYQQVQDTTYKREQDDLSTENFQLMFKDFLNDPNVRNSIAEYKFIALSPTKIPWTTTGIHLKPGQQTSTFAAGRVWRSRDLDLYLRSQFALWFKIGVNGTVFNSTQHTNTFPAENEGEIYLANQFPGQFGEPRGGRLVGLLNTHKKADGRFEVLFVAWKNGVNVSGILSQFQSSADNKTSLVQNEIERIHEDAAPKVPEDWSYLWFLGKSSIYNMRKEGADRCIHCKPYGNVGILQKDLATPMSFKTGTRVNWDWNILSLPSRLREDHTVSHDYLSIALEFENGRDLTYTWSWELPMDFGFWCPLTAWADREYHVVIRSGTSELGQWLSEERDLYADYVKYVEEGKEDAERIPSQIVRVWLIAGNRWQRFDGEMLVKRICISNKEETVHVL